MHVHRCALSTHVFIPAISTGCVVFYSLCYSLYKIGKNKRTSATGPQRQVDNQYDGQLSSNVIPLKQQGNSSSYTEEYQQTLYEHVQPR